ncbi:sensor histidine kinase [Streptomyces lushanensis]|uniref:sensor histidine kinase n=1 Tax=Streptomyces lushanensis TaxID=1434255 RepID=UPI000832E334|nr:HAMP domain-containing sensor histidine kinase [Streptomyces lushanensis]
MNCQSHHAPPYGGRLSPRTLRGRLTAGLLVLVALACLTVGITTAFALNGFLTDRLDQQLSASGGRFAAGLEPGSTPDAGSPPDTRGQPEGTFGARLVDGTPAQAAVVEDRSDETVPLTVDDRRALAAVPVDGKGHTLRLSGLGAYRVTAVPGDGQDVLVTGLPLRPVEDTVHRLQGVEAAVFGVTLVATGTVGALWIRLSLRPLRAVTAAAAGAAGLPPADGEVAVPGAVPVGDPHTEAGQVGTAVNRMLGQVANALERQRAGEERLRRFAADAGHELRTPVATVRGHAELALRHGSPVPAEVRHSLDRIRSESERMTRLVDDLLLLARIDAGRALDHGPVDLTRLVLDAAQDARAAGPGHRWLLDLPEEAVTTTGDERRLHQVIGNLLANARSHTPDGTEVSVRLSAGPGTVRLTVADNGPGIPAPLLPEVFGRFVRADGSRSRKGGSTGLGLAIVHAVVTAHGGTVDAVSGDGRTEFTVALPAPPPDGEDDTP